MAYFERVGLYRSPNKVSKKHILSCYNLQTQAKNKPNYNYTVYYNPNRINEISQSIADGNGVFAIPLNYALAQTYIGERANSAGQYVAVGFKAEQGIFDILVEFRGKSPYKGNLAAKALDLVAKEIWKSDFQRCSEFKGSSSGRKTQRVRRQKGGDAKKCENVNPYFPPSVPDPPVLPSIPKPSSLRIDRAKNVFIKVGKSIKHGKGILYWSLMLGALALAPKARGSANFEGQLKPNNGTYPDSVFFIKLLVEIIT